jgi:hypothetical protein
MTYADRSSQIGGTKPFTGTALSGNSYTHQLYYGGQHYNLFTNTGIPLFADDIPIYKGQPYAGITNAAGQAVTFNNAGQLTPFINGQLTGSGLVQAGGSGFAIGDYDNFLNDSERLQGTLLGHYDITDHIRFNGEVWLGRNFATNVAAQPYYNTAQFNSRPAQRQPDPQHRQPLSERGRPPDDHQQSGRQWLADGHLLSDARQHRSFLRFLSHAHRSAAFRGRADRRFQCGRAPVRLGSDGQLRSLHQLDRLA